MTAIARSCLPAPRPRLRRSGWRSGTESCRQRTGLIEVGYRGELEVLLLNTDREEACELRAGDRVAQLVVALAPRPSRRCLGLFASARSWC